MIFLKLFFKLAHYIKTIWKHYIKTIWKQTLQNRDDETRVILVIKSEMSILLCFFRMCLVHAKHPILCILIHEWNTFSFTRDAKTCQQCFDVWCGLQSSLHSWFAFVSNFQALKWDECSLSSLLPSPSHSGNSSTF